MSINKESERMIIKDNPEDILVGHRNQSGSLSLTHEELSGGSRAGVSEIDNSQKDALLDK